MTTPGEMSLTESRAVVRSRITDALQQAGVDGYLAFTPSNVFYVSGYVSYFLSNWWRMHGTVASVLSAQPGTAPALVLGDAEEASACGSATGCDIYSYPMWVETRDLAGIRSEPDAREVPRPDQFRDSDLDEALRSALAERGLLSGRVGTDLRYVLLDTYERLRRIAPDVEWVDLTDEMYRLRSVKLPFEIDRLARAAHLAEAGMAHATGNLHLGMTLAELRSHFVEGVAREARSSTQYQEFSDLWVIPGMGGQASIASSATDHAGLTPGDLVKFDCGTTVGGYRSDSGRTFAFGRPSDDAARLYGVLRDAHRRAVDMIRPGTKASSVYREASGYVQDRGYPGYRRGHFGHSVGIDTFHEEPPFLSPTDDTPLEAGMVLAVETPFYGADVGPIMLEDLVEVTADGCRYLTHLPRELRTVGS